jgi:integrase
LALKRAIRHAEAKDLVARNVAVLADTPKGQQGRPSKSLTLDQAAAVITAARTLPVMELQPGLKDVRRPVALMHAYVALSLLAGIRTEETRALRWSHVDLDGNPAARPPVPPHVAVWRSVRVHGETKTERSRLRAWSGSQAGERLAAGDGWQDAGLVFTNHLGAALDAGNVRKMFKRVCAEAGVGDGWTPRELRTTFVSLLSHRGVSIEEIARLVGHASTRTTEIGRPSPGGPGREPVLRGSRRLPGRPVPRSAAPRRPVQPRPPPAAHPWPR